jgi:hypothetical protein
MIAHSDEPFEQRRTLIEPPQQRETIRRAPEGRHDVTSDWPHAARCRRHAAPGQGNSTPSPRDR